MATKIELINSALRECGANRIENEYEDTFEAKLIKDIYDLVVEQVMVQGDWVSLRKRAVLTRINIPPEFGYKNVFQMPIRHKWLRLLEFNKDKGLSPVFQVEGEFLYTDSDTAEIVYIAKDEVVGNWEAPLVAAVRAGLKVAIANAMNTEEGTVQRRLQEYIGAVKDGQSLSSSQASSKRLFIGNYINVRR